MIKDIKELNFPKYATLETASAMIADMGDRTITSQVKIAGDVVPDFSYDWEVEFKGERYIHPVKTPQGTKDNTSRKSKIDLVFQHWAIYEMKRQYFVEMASTAAGTAIADKYIASLGLNLGDFVTAFNLVLNHYFGGRIIIKLNPEWQYDTEAKFVSISYSYIWDVLQQMHEIYGVRWTLKTNADGVCEILMGYPAQEVSHIFEYGFEGGLLSVQRQVQSSDIRNRLLGRGGSKNLPYRYFKDKDPNNPLFEADPDWIPELANISFTELRGKTFRDYVKGWKAKRYGGTPMAEPTEAYLIGYNADKFDPIEYVDDKESIEKYGILVGALENNEEIYPSIQGAPGEVDMIVDAEQVTDDDVDAAVENDSVTTNLDSGHQTYRNAPANSTITIETLTKRYFSVPAGKVGNLDMSLTVTGKYSNVGDYEPTYPILKDGTVKITIYDRNTDAIITSSTVPVINIPAGDYYYMISAEVETNYDKESMVTLNIESVHLYTSTPDAPKGWQPTFDIWVRNIWGSERNAGETDQQYADRVWLPILGDRMGDEARVVFASGWLSFSSDWEFPIVGYAFDDSKEGSHWRLTLAKSEAELEASGKYIPYEGYNASAGDRFFFIGIDMSHQYVLWTEERLDVYKRDRLPETARINPSWVIKTDKVRLNQDREGSKLIDSLSAGAQIRLASKQFISDAYESLYVQSMTYNWTSDTILYPDVEVVVSDKVHTVKNPVAQIQGNIETLQRQMGSLSNLQQIIRQVCDQLYLRKDGVEDLSKSPTRFLGKVTGGKFRQGRIGGRDWGIYRDENGNAILEADKLVARQGILVSNLVVNEATYVGGLQINSAAAMKITAVDEAEGGYICYFDQQQGSVTNKFRVDDVALCQKFDFEDNEVKFYKRRVVAIDETSVTLSKTDVSGDGIPAVDDEIIHYGNYSDKTRQFVIIRDVIGGGYERMLMGLDSVTSEGVEYYFAGKSADSKARWFVGGAEQYAEYKDGQLTIKGNIFVTGSDQNINEQIAQLDFIRNAFGENAQGLILGTAIVVGYNDDEGKFVPMAGLSGVYDKEADNGGPAAWYGGTPEDAKSVIFMDGTGYFADGLFKWDKTKGVNLGNDAIKINYDGSVEFGGNIKIGGTGEETLDSLLTIVATLADIWKIDEETGDLVTDRNVRIAKNVIIGGDMSSAAKGRDAGAAGGIIGVKVGDAEYTDITAGILDMTDAFKDLDVDLSDYYTKDETVDLLNTAITGIDLSGYALKSDVNKAIADLINGAPETLDTLKEVADALAENADVVDALNAAIGNKADKATTLAGYGITDAYTKVNVDDLLKKYLLLEAESQTIKGNLKIEGNLIIAGDMSSEGTGGNSGADGTVIGVVVNGTQYADETNGMLDLSLLMNQYALATAIPSLDGYAKLTDLPTKASLGLGNVENKSSATIRGEITATNVTNALGYTPLSTGGGTITSVSTDILNIMRDTTDGSPVIKFSNKSGVLGYLGISDEGKASVWNARLTSVYTLYHSGNLTTSVLSNLLGTTGNGGKVLASTNGGFGWVSLPTTLPASDVYAWAKAATKPTYTASEVGALSTSGGTVDGDITIRAANSYSDSWLKFTDKGTSEDYAIGIRRSTASYGLQFKANGDYYKIYHSGNFNPSDYLPKSGGAISGASSAPLSINSTSSTVALNLQQQGTGKLQLGWDSSNGIYLYDYASKHYIGINTSGTPYYYDGASYRGLIHSGNIGEQRAQRAKYLDTLNAAGSSWYDNQYVVYGQWGSDDILDWKVDNYEVRVDRAKKLQTARTIWGQSFDGSGNIDGALSVSGTWNNYSSLAVFEKKDSYDAKISIKNTVDSLNLVLNGAGNACVSVAGQHSLIFEINNTARMLINSSGNILIGTTTDNGTKVRVDGKVFVNRYEAENNSGGADVIINKAGTYYIGIGSATSNKASFAIGRLATVTGGWASEDIIIADNGAITMSSSLSIGGSISSVVNVSSSGTISSSSSYPFSLFAVGSGTYNRATVEFTSSGLVIERARKTDSSSAAVIPLIISQRGGGVAAKFDGNDFSVTGNTNIGGNIVIAGDMSSTSDMRLKQRIDDVILDLNTIAEMPIFTFRWKDGRDSRLHLGSSAQYWEKPAPWLVMEDSFKTLNYPVLGVAGIKSLAVTAVDHETRIKMLERKVNELETENRRLRYGN